MSLQRYRLVSLEPPIDAVMKRLGYNRNKTEMAEEWRVRIHEEISHSISYIHPLGNILDLKISMIDNDQIQLANDLIIESEKLADILEKSRIVTLMLCTIGEEIEEISRDSIESGDITRGVIWDAIGSEAVEEFAEYLHEVLRQKYRVLGYRSTIRFSPGYGDLNVSFHKEMLPVLDAESIGIKCLNESYLLDPQKSISAIIGWTK